MSWQTTYKDSKKKFKQVEKHIGKMKPLIVEIKDVTETLDVDAENADAWERLENAWRTLKSDVTLFNYRIGQYDELTDKLEGEFNEADKKPEGADIYIQKARDQVQVWANYKDTLKTALDNIENTRAFEIVMF